MKKNRSPKKSRRFPKPILRLPDLDHAKAAVLESRNGFREARRELVVRVASDERLGDR